MPTLLRPLLVLLAGTAALLGAALATPATDAAKARCEIGERNDGYLGVVDGARVSETVRRDLREINQKRAAAYDRLAARNGVSRQDAARLTAEKLINSAPSGHCVQDASGSWVKVP